MDKKGGFHDIGASNHRRINMYRCGHFQKREPWAWGQCQLNTVHAKCD